MSAGAAVSRPWSGTRGWTAAAVAVVAVFVVLGVVSEGLTPAPQGPAGSSFATSTPGVAAWAQLLVRARHPVVQLRTPLGSTRLPPSATLVVLDASSLSSSTGRVLRRFIAAGGRLVIGGGDARATLPAVVADPPRVLVGGPATFGPVAAAPEVSGVRTVRTAGEASFAPVAGSAAGVVALGAGGRGLLIVRHVGAGTVDLLADPSPLENRLLASADDAQLSLNLAGGRGRAVVFAEALHGYAPASGLAAIPTRGWLVFAGLVLAAAAWALARGRRLGPAQPTEPPGAPPRAAYVDALGDALTRAKDFSGR